MMSQIVISPKLASSFVDDFKNDRPDIDISFIETKNRVHDRYIAIDIKDSFRSIFLQMTLLFACVN